MALWKNLTPDERTAVDARLDQLAAIDSAFSNYYSGCVAAQSDAARQPYRDEFLRTLRPTIGGTLLTQIEGHNGQRKPAISPENCRFDPNRGNAVGI